MKGKKAIYLKNAGGGVPLEGGVEAILRKMSELPFEETYKRILALDQVSEKLDAVEDNIKLKEEKLDIFEKELDKLKVELKSLDNYAKRANDLIPNLEEELQNGEGEVKEALTEEEINAIMLDKYMKQKNEISGAFESMQNAANLKQRFEDLPGDLSK